MADNFSGGPALATKGRRFAAAIVDLVVVPLVLGVILGIILIPIQDPVRTYILGFMNLAWLIFRDMVFSPGRHMVGIKLVSLTGAKVNFGQALIRNLLIGLPLILLVGYIVEIIALIAKGERISDAWAKTRVVSA